MSGEEGEPPHPPTSRISPCFSHCRLSLWLLNSAVVLIPLASIRDDGFLSSHALKLIVMTWLGLNCVPRHHMFDSYFTAGLSLTCLSSMSELSPRTTTVLFLFSHLRTAVSRNIAHKTSPTPPPPSLSDVDQPPLLPSSRGAIRSTIAVSMKLYIFDSKACSYLQVQTDTLKGGASG